MIGLFLAAQLAVVAHAPDTASACAPIDVTVAARVAGNAPAHIAPMATPAGLQFLKSAVTTRVERDGAGRQSSLTEATFTYASSSATRIALPSFVATAGTLRETATPNPVTVHESGALPPTVMVRAWLDRGENRGPVDTLYVGQQMDYVVDVYLNEPARQRLRRNPTFFPPEMPGVLAYDLAAPSSVTRNGRECFQTLSYRRALFPLFAGRSAIAPAALTYSLPLSTSFFSREESFELRTDSVRFVAQDVPAAGRPTDFGGAVGALSIASRLSAAQARMGDPVVLTVRVEGSGNVKLWPRPSIRVPWGTIADGAERVEVDTTQSRVRGAKEFDWLLTPRTAGTQEVGKIEYPYYDAEQRKYGTATAAPLHLEVASAALATIDSTPAARLAIRRTLGAERSEPLTNRPWFWVLLAAAPIPVAVRRTRERRVVRASNRSALERIRTAAVSAAASTPSDVRRMYLSAIRERVPTTVGSTRAVELSRALRRSGVSEDTAERAAAWLDTLDAAAFSATGRVDANALKRSAGLVEEIDAQAIRSAPRVARVIAVIAVLIASSALAVPPGVDETFSEGVQAYDHAAFTTAQRLFARVVSRAPAAADAWANLGTAAFASGDSAAAVRGWQRALRLDPLDDDARDRLERVQPAVIRSPGYVPPIPLDAPAIVCLVLWIAGWLLLALPVKRRPARARMYSGIAITIAIVGLFGALELRDHLEPTGLAVLRDTRLLLEAPGSSVAAASGVVGETGQLGAREGAWIRIALDRSRAGWVPIASVLPLDGPPGSD